MTRRLVVAGVTSGVGKTTIACALMAAFARRGHRVQPFKAGPDYIDPGHHTAAAGRPSRNLDSVLLSRSALLTLFVRAAQQADFAVIEGVMGLFDGRTGQGEAGSTAEIAKIVGAPVVVVIDAAKTARTAGAIALGCARFDADLAVAGFILNRIGSEAHARTAREAVEAATGLPVLGVMPRDPALDIPERHLGLVPTAERALSAGFVARLAAAAEAHLNLDGLWRLGERVRAVPLPLGGEGEGGVPADQVTRETVGQGGSRGRDLPDGLFPPVPVPPRATIAVARDAAFSFYYEDSLEILAAWGAEIVSFSPLADEALPRGTQGLYIGGGFPEVFAPELANNRPIRKAVTRAAAGGIPIYGECGGLMYLARALSDFEGVRHEMAGVIPVDSVMQRRRVTLGYRTVTALRSNPLMASGVQQTGHEFHYSELASAPRRSAAAYEVVDGDGRAEGYARGNVLGSYVHLHFGSSPTMARRFVAACARSQAIG